jgi:Carbohydrate-binding family 9
MNAYLVRRSPAAMRTSMNWNGPAWKNAEALDIANYLPQSSDHRPVTRVKLLHEGSSVHALFKVSDCYVRAVRTEYQDDVWNDSCVEWFAQPKKGKGYFNFEINCIGTLHVHYVEDPTRAAGGELKKSTPVPRQIGALVDIHHSIASVIDSEIKEPTEWYIEMEVPLIFFEPFVGPLGALSGQTWRANFNKCADQTSRPTWATWSPVSEPNFHRPQEFGEIVFE